jgi:hypothetical protein
MARSSVGAAAHKSQTFALKEKKVMTHFLKSRILVLTATLLVAAIAVGATERPFAGSGSGIAVMSVDADGIPSAVVTGSGNATHLGMFTNAGKVVFHPDASNPNLAHPSGAVTFVAANGDKLEAVIEGGTVDLTTGFGDGDFRFIGGTGRFANATGIIHGVVEQNFVTGAYQITIVGNINY